MKAEITNNGTLIIKAESGTESYAIKTWIRQSMTRLHDVYADSVMAGTLLIEDQNGKEMTDKILDGENDN